VNLQQQGVDEVPGRLAASSKISESGGAFAGAAACHWLIG